MSDFIEIFEVGPRDGLQNESKIIDTESKITLVNLLSECGLPKIEVSSFVSSKWVPQLADAASVFKKIIRKQNVKYAALTPNLEGFKNATLVNVDEVAIFAAASETFSKKNINCSIEESITRFHPLMKEAKRLGISVRGYISCITDCPYEGEINPSMVLHIAKQFKEMGCYQISLGDTIGNSTPTSLSKLYRMLFSELPETFFAGHFHDTKGRALDNVELSLENGIKTFDSSIAGLGGCPYAPGASGNVSTEKIIKFIETMGYHTKARLDKIKKASDFAKSLVYQ